MLGLILGSLALQTPDYRKEQS